MKSISIFIADDHELIRKAVRDLLSETWNLVCAGEASNGTELLKIIKKSSLLPDLVLLDIRMPYPTTPDQFIFNIKRQYPSIKIVIISSYSDPILLYTLVVKIGIEGYILKNDTNHELITALKKIALGQKYYSHHIYPTVIKLLNKENSLQKLSQREKDVLRLIHYDDADIAKKLNISIYTVRTYINRIRTKLNLKSRFEVLRFAIRYNYISHPKCTHTRDFDPLKVLEY